MVRKMEKAAAIIFLVVFVAGCSNIPAVMQKTEEMSVETAMSGCSNARSLFRADSPEPEITAENRHVLLVHELSRNCCKNVTVSADARGSAVSITEIHEGYACKCVCDSALESRIGPFDSGNYEIGVYYQDLSYTTEKELLFKTNITV